MSDWAERFLAAAQGLKNVWQEPQEEGLVRGPRQSRRALAATQGEDMPVRGVFHTPSEGEKARETARAMGRQRDWHDYQWWLAFHQGETWPADWWEAESLRLHAEWTRLWDIAEEISDAAGFPYYNRYGLQVFPKGVPPQMSNDVIEKIKTLIEEGVLTLARTPMDLRSSWL